MAASDQTYRKQSTLHIVFAVSAVAMLATTVWMFWDDYSRPFKKEQRMFRDVEAELAKRAVLASAPTDQDRQKVVDAEKRVADARAVLKDIRAQADVKARQYSADQVKDERHYADVKASFDSVTSFYNIEVEHHGPDSPAAKAHRKEMENYQLQMDKLKRDIEERQAKMDALNTTKYKSKAGGEEVELTPDDADARLAREEEAHKKETENFDRFVKLVNQKQWVWYYDGLRGLPVLDAFASPIKIQQYTLDELPIDYSFKFVTRYDRCTTCHLGMEKANYDKETLAKLAGDPSSDDALARDLENAKKTIDERNKIIDEYNKKVPSKDQKDKLPITSDDLKPQRIEGLTPSRINMFAAHPRLDLFVDANSPHPAEEFGCSACHGGQGSATGFVDAVHTPNDVLQRAQWKQEHHWQPIHFWDFPMQPQRFKESGCVKCHHQITDLIRDGNKIEAPTLMQGYNLVRELGCFGCHEIAGMNKGRWVGPDLRLEPDPPLESLTPEERGKLLADPANPPGTMRKVGPNLARVAEKTNEEWARQWIKSPRTFRPTTRMPHYYGLVNNTPEVLPDNQKRFPDAEVHSITHYLFAQSRDWLKQIQTHSKDDETAKLEDAKKLVELTAQMSNSGLTDEQKRKVGLELAQVRTRIAARKQAPLAVDVIKLPAAPADDAAKTQQIEHGRHLFSSRGCLACHQHGGVAKEAGQFEGKPVPPIESDKNFGPDLTLLAAKIQNVKGLDGEVKPELARAWLIGWLLNPSAHNSRTYMPAPFHADDPQVALQEANDIAAWLLSQSSKWAGVPVEKPDIETLKALAKTWLEKSLTQRELKSILEEGKGFSKEQIDIRPADSDERFLQGELTSDKLMMYIGKKAINNLGCFGCHSIPGFESAKTIGTGLNEWGKKDPDRIAFEDSEHFVENHFNIVDVRRPLTPQEKEGGQATTWSFKDGKPPYEKFYSEQLNHNHYTRVGFLHLKLQEPRSFDYNRVRTWDERLRMPQFQFSHTVRKAGESEEDYQLRSTREEAVAREAVMTFILGLVAEPVPPKYVHSPSGDKGALTKGRQVLEKFNCAGCHIVQPAMYEFMLTKKVIGEREETQGDKTVKVPLTARDSVLGYLEGRYTQVIANLNDYPFPEHNAWVDPTAKRPDRLKAYGVVGPNGPFTNEDEDKFGENEKLLLLRLTRAMRFQNLEGVKREFPASQSVFINRDALGNHFDQFGGDFSYQLVKYLQARDSTLYTVANQEAYSAGPPSLEREGEKVQPAWLFQFLLNPTKIRPLTVLRMPKFNMSSEDAQALVDYFAATNHMSNPGIGLTYPYLAAPEKESSYLTAKTAEYVARLKKNNVFDSRVKEMQPIWEQIAKDQLADAESRKKIAQVKLDEAKKKNEGVDVAEKAVKDIDEEISRLRPALDARDFKAQQQQWEHKEAYIVDAFRLASSDQLCLKCHQVGSVPGQENKGPSLAIAAERLRPDWSKRWVTSPQRFLHFNTVMPLNFKPGEKDNANLFLGSDQQFSLDQITAVRDLFMNYPQVADWPVLKTRPGAGTAGGK